MDLTAVEVIEIADGPREEEGPPPAPCECAAPGWCPRHKRRKQHALWSNCRLKPHYRAHWDAMAAAIPDDEFYTPAPEYHEAADGWRRVGLGDLVALGAGLLGFRPCGGCKGRHVRFNRVRLPVPAAVAEAAPPPPTTWVSIPDLPPRFGLTDPFFAVAMTTAPRAEPCCAATLVSLARAGFTDVRIFAEPGSVVPDVRGAIGNEQTRGVFPNWLYALRVLRATRPDAAVYGVVQDDLVFPRGLRGWLERDLLAWPRWREGRVGFVSTYRSEGKMVPVPTRASHRTRRGVHRHDDREWRPSERYLDHREPATPAAGGRAILRERARLGSALWGACTYWLSPAAVDVLLSDPAVQTQKRMIDLHVHPALAARGLEAWYYNPSLTEHRAGPSSIGHGSGRGMSSGGNFVGEECEL